MAIKLWVALLPLAVLLHLPASSASPLEIPAMGRHAFIGELYNATAGNFTGTMIFNRAIEGADIIQEYDNSYTKTSYSIVDSLRDKVAFLKVSAEIALQVTTENVDLGLTGQAAFIKDDKSSRKHVEGVLVHNVLTKKSSIQLLDEGVRGYVSTEILEKTNATHVVIGVYHGAEVYIKFVDTNVENKKVQDIAGKLEITLQLSKLTGEATGELNKTSSDIYRSFNYSLQVFGDIPIDSIPTNAQEVQQLITSIPEKLMEINSGKGVPLRYVLAPVSELRKAFKLDAKLDKLVHTLDEDKLNRIMVTLDEVSQARQSLNDLAAKLEGNSEIVPPHEQVRMRNLSAKFDEQALAFKANVREALIQVRSTGSQELLSTVQKDYIVNEFAPASIRGKLQYDFAATERKIPFFQNFRDRGFTYLGKSHSLGPYLIRAQSTLVYILYFSFELVERETWIWEQNRELLSQIEKEWSSIAVLDCDFWKARCENLTHTVIQGYFKGRLGTRDARLDMPLRDESLKLLPALGGTNVIGDLYDAAVGKFTGESIFLSTRSHNKTVPSSKGGGSCSAVQTQGWVGLLTELEAPAELGFLLYSGRPILAGSGEVFLRTYNPPIGQTASLVCINKTRIDSLNIAPDRTLFDILDMATMARSGATHFIEKIEFGSATFITFNHSSPGQAKADANSWLRRVERSLTTKRHVNVRTPGGTNSSMKLFSDISPRFTHELSGKDLLEFLEEAPELGRRLNEGRGVPVLYTLRPVSVLKRSFAVASSSANVPAEHEKVKRAVVSHCGKQKDTLVCIRRRFDFFDRVKREYVGYVHDFDSFSEAFGDTEGDILYLLLFKYQWIHNQSQAWARNSAYFFNQTKAMDNGLLFAIDCNFFEDEESTSICQGVTQPTIFAYKDGVLASRDFLNEGPLPVEVTEDMLQELLQQQLQDDDARLEAASTEFTEKLELLSSAENASQIMKEKYMAYDPVFVPPSGFVYIQHGREADPRQLWNDSARWQEILSLGRGWTSLGIRMNVRPILGHKKWKKL